MLNVSIILFRYKQFASKIYNAISMHYFLCKLITDLHNSLHHWTKSNAQKFGSVRFGSVRVRFGFGKKFLVRSFPRVYHISTCESTIYIYIYVRVTHSHVLQSRVTVQPYLLVRGSKRY